MAFKTQIHANSIKERVHSVSPAYVITFIRWDNRDTANFKNANDPLLTRLPLVVTSDAIAVNTSDAKDSPTPSCQIVLKGGDINYLTAVAPSDYVLVNMLDSEKDADIVAQKASDGKAINGIHDGFKGVYKIQDVRRQLSNGGNGQKDLIYQVSAFAFSELQSKLYFNQNLKPSGESAENPFLFMSQLNTDFNAYFNANKRPKLQGLFKFLHSSILGQGIYKQGFSKDKVKIDTPNNVNNNYKVPNLLGTLLGIESAKTVPDITDVIIGIHDYDGSSNIPKIRNRDGRYYDTTSDLAGIVVLQADYWNNVTVLSALQKYSDLTINELYTCFRISPDNKVLPTLILRQKPFNSHVFQKGKTFNNPQLNITEEIPHTKFTTLPRWKLDPEMVYSDSIGRSESQRFNFVQVDGYFANFLNPGVNAVTQLLLGNYEYDKDDVQRNGLKPFTVGTNADGADGVNESKVREYTKLVSDWVIGGHLKLNGQISCAGIQEPICVGDNLEYNGMLFHIESITHDMSIQGNGEKEFRTTLGLSHGIAVAQNKEHPVYSEMDFTDAFTYRLNDYNRKDGTLPGFSDVQDIAGRSKGEELSNTKEESFQNPSTKKRQES